MTSYPLTQKQPSKPISWVILALSQHMSMEFLLTIATLYPRSDQHRRVSRMIWSDRTDLGDPVNLKWGLNDCLTQMPRHHPTDSKCIAWWWESFPNAEKSMLSHCSPRHLHHRHDRGIHAKRDICRPISRSRRWSSKWHWSHRRQRVTPSRVEFVAQCLRKMIGQWKRVWDYENMLIEEQIIS